MPIPILLYWTRLLGYIIWLIIPCVGCVGDGVRSGHRLRLHRHHRLHANLRYECVKAVYQFEYQILYPAVLYYEEKNN